MYITRRRTPVKKKLIQEKLKQNIANNTCPSCHGHMEKIEDREDGDVYACKKCHATNTFAKHSSYVQKKSKEVQLQTMKLVDRSNEKKFDYKNKEQKAKTVGQALMTVVRQAMADKKLLQFEYPKDREMVTRITEPYKLAFDGSKNLILWAYCLEAEGIRIFKLEKMQNAEVKEYSYKPRWDIEDKVQDENGKKAGKDSG